MKKLDSLRKTTSSPSCPAGTPLFTSGPLLITNITFRASVYPVWWDEGTFLKPGRPCINLACAPDASDKRDRAVFLSRRARILTGNSTKGLTFSLYVDNLSTCIRNEVFKVLKLILQDRKYEGLYIYYKVSSSSSSLSVCDGTCLRVHATFTYARRENVHRLSILKYHWPSS